ncbi:MAG: 1-acyl-sn-glycerol-3-phosphate acyltransferase [Actinobacteria bacterium]|nr:1-acyl-sn-glycerol-3-phosphate acyltransferase [Actinomycetota bacterium]
MADLVYPPVIGIVRALWKYLDLRFTFYGQGHIPAKGPAVLAMNHVGYLDFALAGTAFLPTGRLVRFMAKREIFDHPIAGPLMRGMKHISVDRNNGAPSFLAALKTLKKGEIVGVFPEATISQSFELKEMKSGVIRLAMESGAPILPMVIWGSQRIWSKKLPRNLSRSSIPVFISIGQLRYVQPGCDIDRELSALKEAMGQLLKQVQSDYPDPHKGARWAPARLGGSAPSLAELEALRESKRES